jgi:uncharacterized protein YbaR (Trm112 family)
VIDSRILEILACPACLGEVRREGETILCGRCRKKYPVRNGVPVMLEEEATPAAEPEAERA